MPRAFPVTNGMKILLTGGGSGGHFYPIIAVAEALNELIREQHLVEPKLFYMAPHPYNQGLLYNNKIIFKKTPAGKLRRYFSLLNLLDTLKTLLGIIKSIWTVFTIYPDVAFGKGGYASFPPLLAAKLLRIPVIIHESDIVPGRVNLWAGKFAKRIAVSFPETARFFTEGKVAFTGNPIRKEILNPLSEGARELLKLEKEVPVILVLGGSLGAELINNIITVVLPQLLQDYQVIHQVGVRNFEEMEKILEVALYQNTYKNRYRIFSYLNTQALRMAAGAADLVISRAGSTIFEIACWQIPSIIIPITDSNDDHQRKNAFTYARSGACTVIEEANLTSHILVQEVERILKDKRIQESMRKGASIFAKRDAARVIAQEIINMALEHEK
ncbi:MAG: UDP diphospho-muramoyl pentapeptide beta-N acetylglucosaminyl transferase [Parcubacteria group bacterium Gr01-1014_107]|nr:MAG: UDP diphospho-muramoyl pentapeptide beta-N acetylglucosaminyl transferase [Parcubacteria group bacterium Gr01-1014_107]